MNWRDDMDKKSGKVDALEQKRKETVFEKNKIRLSEEFSKGCRSINDAQKKLMGGSILTNGNKHTLNVGSQTVEINLSSDYQKIEISYNGNIVSTVEVFFNGESLIVNPGMVPYYNGDIDNVLGKYFLKL